MFDQVKDIKEALNNLESAQDYFFNLSDTARKGFSTLQREIDEGVESLTAKLDEVKEDIEALDDVVEWASKACDFNIDGVDLSDLSVTLEGLRVELREAINTIG